MFFRNGWILKDIKLIYEKFVSISFVTIPLRCNCVTLTLVMFYKRMRRPLFFFFPL